MQGTNTGPQGRRRLQRPSADSCPKSFLVLKYHAGNSQEFLLFAPYSAGQRSCHGCGYCSCAVPPGTDVAGGLRVPGHSPAQLRCSIFSFPLPGCHLRPRGLRTAGSPAVGPASRLNPGGGFQQESGARNTLSQHSPDSSRFPPPSRLSLPDL